MKTLELNKTKHGTWAYDSGQKINPKKINRKAITKRPAAVKITKKTTKKGSKLKTIRNYTVITLTSAYPIALALEWLLIG